MQTRTILNPTQLHLLKLFSYNDTERALAELKTALMHFYQRKLDGKLDELWEKGDITPGKMEEIKAAHLRKRSER